MSVNLNLMLNTTKLETYSARFICDGVEVSVL